MKTKAIVNWIFQDPVKQPATIWLDGEKVTRLGATEVLLKRMENSSERRFNMNDLNSLSLKIVDIVENTAFIKDENKLDLMLEQIKDLLEDTLNPDDYPHYN